MTKSFGCMKIAIVAIMEKNRPAAESRRRKSIHWESFELVVHNGAVASQTHPARQRFMSVPKFEIEFQAAGNRCNAKETRRA